MNAEQILDREYLEIRAKILEVAAALDRIDRAAGDVSDHSRMTLLKDAIGVVAAKQDTPIRAEKIQLLFSRQYDVNWLEQFGLTTETS